MEDDVLFVIRKEHLETGLRGFPVGYCTTSSVDSQKGLFYAGLPLSDLVTWTPEQVIYLLYAKKVGSQQDVERFTDDLRSRASLDKRTVAYIEGLPREGDPMKLFIMALLAAGFNMRKDYREDALDLIAKVPSIAAAVINTHGGFGKTTFRSDLGYIENFAAMLRIPKAHPQLGEVLSLFNILHYDHGGGNLSAFVGKAVASGLEDMYGSIAAAMLALSGPRHGRANEECLHFVQDVLKEVNNAPTPLNVEQVLRHKLAKGELLFGFGHAVLRVEDPRATIQYALAEKIAPDSPLVKTALALRTAGPIVLKENPKISNPYPNVDAISGTLLTTVNFPYPAYYPVLFGLARTVGISIQIIYERLEARNGKGTPIVRPKYLYKDTTSSG